MITVRTNHYTIKEKTVLLNLLKEARDNVVYECCIKGDNRCTTCDCKNICDDLARTTTYLKKSLNRPH